MGLKTIILLIAVVLLLIEGISGGMLSKFIFPHKEELIGRFLCNIGGYIANPFLTIGKLKIPIPSTDDVIVASVATTAITGFIYRKKIHSMKRLLIAVFITWWIMFFAYKSIGIVMVYFAEKVYHQEQCIEIIQTPFGNIQYSWFSALFILGMILGICGLVGVLLKTWLNPEKKT